MTHTSTSKISSFSEVVDDDFTAALLEGLSQIPKAIPCKFFYDETGSALFEKICTLPEYYPTRTELSLLRQHAPDFAALIGPEVDVIEFGAGALQKIQPLLDALERPSSFIPIDISGDHLQEAATQLASIYPSLAVVPVVADFTKDFALPENLKYASRRIGFFPGSTIGNFDPTQAKNFMQRAAHLLKGGGLLIGVDLIKDPAILHAAYNDRQGITSRFNKNILVRANNELDANFDIEQFAHYAFYNPTAQRIEMHLISLIRQTVSFAGSTFSFAAGETIHTENSYKYTVDGFHDLARQAGFRPHTSWVDADQLFSLHWLESE